MSPAALLTLLGLLALIGWVMARDMKLRPASGFFRPVMLGFLPFAVVSFHSLASLQRDPELGAKALALFSADFVALMIKGGSKLGEAELQSLAALMFRLQAGFNSVLWLALVTAMALLIRRWLAKRGKAAPAPELSRWKTPDLLIWAALLPAAFVLFGDRGLLGEIEPWQRDACLNLLILGGSVYLFQGMMVVVERLRKAGLPKFLGALIALAALLAASTPKGKFVVFAFLGLGLFETWYDFRGLAAPVKRDNDNESERSEP